MKVFSALWLVFATIVGMGIIYHAASMERPNEFFILLGILSFTFLSIEFCVITSWAITTLFSEGDKDESI
jgi:hypothetical protein